jgi:hypothetical protein
MKNRHKGPFRGLTQIRVSIISTATRDRLVRMFSKNGIVSCGEDVRFMKDPGDANQQWR